MKKIFSLTALIVMSASLAAQNVGVGTNNPAEKLDVNGNLNISGNLKINGVSGQSGQVLRTNSSGVTEWGDFSAYNNQVAYTQNGIWNVPPGVTKITIEAWGGGGGGAEGGGGASGSYMQAINIPVAYGNELNITIGAGGAGAQGLNLNAQNGGNTSVFIPDSGKTYTAYGGGGAYSLGPGGAQSVGQIGDPHIVHVVGKNGEYTRETYHRYTADYFMTVREYGKGADAVMINGPTGGQGQFRSFYTVELIILKYTYSQDGKGYGAGGGGGPSGSNPFGASGGPGIVIIHY